MRQISVRGRPILVQQPKKAFGEHIAEFLCLCPLETVGVVGILEDSPHGRDRLQSLLRIQDEEPVLVVDVGEKGAVTFDVDGEGPATFWMATTRPCASTRDLASKARTSGRNCQTTQQAAKSA